MERLKAMEEPLWPEKSSSWFSQLTFSYLTPLLRRGARQTLNADDLWRCAPAERVATLRSGGGGFRGKLRRSCYGLLRASGYWQFFVSAAQLVQPLVVRALVLAVSEDDPAAAKRAGLRVSAAIAFLTVFAAFAQQRQLHLATRCGTRVRALAIAEVYAAALRRP
eukprot:CAMPEP_0119266846 /NCGR_PEP_ID=MMETSP1329-20130426/5188_1 /TAXON_ID=114041 /ORGANISM="Genus nov. species nov., Strain RCC1024" /LENGTH=164 /DNA_ID=CAMNT_0007266745 /DNA_START=146 /DNA_END=637 /DNA_ORIENTATION=+